MKPKLIILRGPSGAGKSTVASALRRESTRPTLIIDQDYYRHVLLDSKPDEKEIVPKMIYDNTMIALNAGYNVIIEGIFRKEKYAPMFQRLLRRFGGESYVYYFAVSFEETAKRHQTREKSALFTANDMREWYGMAEPLGFTNEWHISQNSSEAETIALIKRQTAI